MFVVRLLKRKGLVANRARIRHLTGMQPFVFLQKIFRRKHLGANLAAPLLAVLWFR